MRRVVPVLIFTAIAIASCSSRPVVFSAPWFDADEARKSNPAVLLPEDIDIQAMVPDFIAAYDGDPGRGVREARSVLLDCLTGERISQLSSRGVRLDFVDATSTLPRVRSSEWEGCRVAGRRPSTPPFDLTHPSSPRGSVPSNQPCSNAVRGTCPQNRSF